MSNEYDQNTTEPKYVSKSNGLINRAACRAFALRWAKRRTGCNFQRVSKSYLDNIETKVMLMIQRSVNSHRSVGKTITDFI